MRGGTLSDTSSATGRVVGSIIGLCLLFGLTACDGCNDAPAAAEFDIYEVSPDSADYCAGAICGAGEICRRDRCTAPCDGDDECIFGERCTADNYCYPEIPGGTGETCEAHDDCDSRECVDGACIPARACVNDAECFSDEICSLDGACVPACSSDDECPDGESCTNGGCMVADGECDQNEDCASGECADGVCAPTCDPEAETAHCGLDTACGGLGVCQPRCSFDEACEGGICVHGRCVAGTGTDSPGLSPGDPEEGGGGDLDDPPISEDGRVAECLTNLDCADEGVRCEDGTCIPYEICATDEECGEGTYCQRGQCRPFCTVDDECPGDQTCDGDGRCSAEPEDVACRSTEQCEPCESCIFGVCTVSEYFCREDDDCGIDKLCRNGFCTYECEAAEDCPRGQSCIDMVCLDDPPPTAECVFNEECGGEFLCINGRCHTECLSHSECGSRMMCDHGVCQPDRRPGLECTRSEHCADLGGECVDGHCALACWEDRECATGACDVGFCTR